MKVTQATNEARHYVRGTEGMREPRVIGTRVRERGEAELPYPSQSLNLCRCKQPLDDVLFLGFEGDKAVDGVTQDHLGSRAPRLTRFRNLNKSIVSWLGGRKPVWCC